jgi:hypothetical protein
LQELASRGVRGRPAYRFLPVPPQDLRCEQIGDRAVLGWGLPVLLGFLCVAGTGLWILGIPGDAAASYARPWTIGLVSLAAYPVVTMAILIGLTGARLLKRNINTRPFLVALWLALLLFGLVQLVVWSWMLSLA